MKRLFLVITFGILINTISLGQKWIPETICSTDTLIVEPYPPMRYNPRNINTKAQEPYKVIQCKTRSRIGLRMEIAASSYHQTV